MRAVFCVSEMVCEGAGDGLRGCWRWCLSASEMVPHTEEMFSRAEAQRAQSFRRAFFLCSLPYGAESVVSATLFCQSVLWLSLLPPSSAIHVLGNALAVTPDGNEPPAVKVLSPGTKATRRKS